MKKYKVIMSYVMTLPFELLAENEDQAIEEAQRNIDNMTNKNFMLYGRPQLEGKQVEEIT